MNILETILKRNENHPDALHYFVHVYDQPSTALFALSNSIKYSRISSSSSYAQHMKSHIYLRLGLYDQTLITNLKSNQVGFNPGKQYHSIKFMHYIYLSIGRRSIALQLLQNLKPLFINNNFYKIQYGIMFNRHIIQTQNYSFRFNNPFDLIICSQCISLGDIYWLYQINSTLLLVKRFSTVKNDKYYDRIIIKYVNSIK